MSEKPKRTKLKAVLVSFVVVAVVVIAFLFRPEVVPAQPEILNVTLIP